MFGDAERPKAVGVYEAANFLGLPAGPLLGGWMLSRLWWGWVFLLNVPVVAVGLIALALLFLMGRFAPRLPAALIVVVASILAVKIFNLD